jgi:hypothetical protein
VNEVDTSQLPPDAVVEHVERGGSCDKPITQLRIHPNRPIKVVLVPTTQP